MPLHTPWEASPEFAEAKKTVADVAGRAKTVKADAARIVPKLSTYKKATIEKLLKDAETNFQAALKKNQEYGPGSSSPAPESRYLNALSAAEKAILNRLKVAYERELNACKSELAGYNQSANAFRSKGTQDSYRILCDAYEELAAALKKELAVAAKENPANAARKI